MRKVYFGRIRAQYMKKSLSENLIREWHPTKNGALEPQMFSAGSNIEVWWLGQCGHEWKARISKRSLGHGCIYCSNQKVLSGFNDLKTKNPELAEDWDYDKNMITPQEVLPNSNKAYWWLCKNGHSWLATVSNRNKGKGCPYCSNRRAWKGYNDLKTVNPKLASEWDYAKNKIKPDDVLPGCNDSSIWWVCSLGHEWQDSPNHRRSGRGCPYCAHHKISINQSLAKKYPDLLKEWDYSNNQLNPEEIGCFSNKRVSWICASCGYHYRAVIANRTKNSSGCPVCSNLRIIKGRNDLATTHPILTSEWDFDNNDLLPTEVGAGSGKSVFWKCMYNHSWRARIAHRAAGGGCPVCSKYLKTSLKEQEVYYYIKKYFKECQNSYNPKFLGKSEIDIWIPSCNIGIEYDGHHWHKSVERDQIKDELCHKNGIQLIRIREYGCPDINRADKTYYLNQNTDRELEHAIISILEFIGVKNPEVDITRDFNKILSLYRKTVVRNSFKTMYPSYLKEWDYEENPDPDYILYNMNIKCSWVCKNCGFKWKAKIYNRVRLNQGCPACAGKKARLNNQEDR